MPDQDELWVVLWCSLLSSVLLGEIPEADRERYFQELSQQERQLPDGQRGRILVRTLRRRWHRLKDEGVSGLYRRRRSDRGQPRGKRAGLLARAVELKKEQPYRSDKVINRILKQESGQTIPSSTMYRHLHLAGATRRKLRTPPAKHTLGSKINNIPAADNQQLQRWRNSGNNWRWERAVTILNGCDSTLEEICAKTERSPRSIYRWIRLYNKHGIQGLGRKNRDRSKSDDKLQMKTRRILEILHERPRSFGINRSNWNLRSLATVYECRHEEKIGRSTVGRLINDANYSFRKARRVLTSPDPNYREKVELVLQTLQSLKPAELFFFVDEMGPVRVKSYGGRCYSQKNDTRSYVDGQTSNGSVTLFGALSATTNQVAWFYGAAKDTVAMIDLAEILFNQYHDQSRLYITWDAASWHSSNALISWLDSFNAHSKEIGDGPAIGLVPLPSRSQFLDVIESVFSGMKRAVIHHSNYASECKMKAAISAHLVERNEYFKHNPRRAGRKIWEADFFDDFKNILSGDYREW